MVRTLHVEVVRKPTSSGKRVEVLELVNDAFDKTDELSTKPDEFAAKFSFESFSDSHPDILRFVQSISVCLEGEAGEGAGGSISNGSFINGNQRRDVIKREIHVYDLNKDDEEAEFMEDEENDNSAASHHWILPNANFEGLWETLLFDHDVKSRLLNYINSALLFAQKGVDPNLISWNKVILLHGPAGTGKTSLCKALAQKATIRLTDRYLYGQLIEINSHSLFSKWFSESGKLVMKMFEKIHDLVEDPKCLVFLLIDEVESLAQCRQSAEAGNEPTDSIRAVNALLTQIDRIKKFPNVVILTTSNIVGCIDLAFVDRADLKIYIGPPPTQIVFEILASSVNELIRVGIIDSTIMFPSSPPIQDNGNCGDDVKELAEIATLATGMSGRMLRKIPFLAYANFPLKNQKINCSYFLKSLRKAVEMEKSEANALTNTTNKKCQS